ncbi:MAG TPA: phosphoglycerate dehydrogenase [Thermomicrobiales bacterium]|nr:phosphoglycerate dehydrogenase [Thermomicrobiales bacterium]
MHQRSDSLRFQPQETPPQLRVAVDLDGVLTEYPAPLADAANRQFGLSLPVRAFVDSAGLNVPLHVREWVYDREGPASRLYPAQGAQEFVRQLVGLVGEGNVMIITARPENSATTTVNWLKHHGFMSCNVIFGDDKMTIARRQGCGYAIEDSERHAYNYAAGGLFCFLIGTDKTAAEMEEENVIPVGEFADILEYLGERLDSTGRFRHLATLPPVTADGSVDRPRIVIADAVHPVARQEFEAHGDVVDVDGMDVPALKDAVRDADALVVRSETLVTAEILGAAPRLKVVARAGVGVDNIDIPAATRAGVIVLNAPGTNAVSAGEHTIALLLALTRQIPFANSTTHAGEWKRKQVKPVDLRGRTVGIVGLGRVGTIVARRLKAFEMTVIAHDPYIPASRFTEIGVEQVTLEEIFLRSDVVTFHCPAGDDTYHLLNAQTLAKMKPGSIVLNAARGEVVDQQALADALRSGHIAAAGVDVFPSEPCTDSPLFGLENVVVTPHTGGSSIEALEAVGRVIGATTMAALRGEAVPNAVNLPPASLEAPALKLLTSVAGAAGHLMSVLMPEIPAGISLEARGLISNDITEHVMNAALSESLRRWLGRRVTPVNARMVADELGLSVATCADDGDATSLPQFRFEVHGETSHSVVITWDRTIAGIVEVDRFSLLRPLEGYVLITHHRDQPGVIGRLGTILARHEVNIAGMQVSRDMPRGEAMMVTNVDEQIPQVALDEIKAVGGVDEAFVVSLPSLTETQDPITLASITSPVMNAV